MHAYGHSDGIVQTKTVSLSEFRESVLNSDPFLLRLLEEGYVLYSRIADSDLLDWIRIDKKGLKVAYFSPTS